MRKAGKEKKKTPGRATKYETNVLPYLEDIKAWLENGNTEESIAKSLRIAYSTFRDYKKEHKELKDVVDEGRRTADIAVQNSLFERCIGGPREVQKAIKLRTVIYKDGKRISETERISYAKETVYVPADTKAIIFWLTNRKREDWKEKIAAAMTDADGKEVRVVLDLEKEAMQ